MAVEAQSEMDTVTEMMRRKVTRGVIVMDDSVKEIEKLRRKAQLKMRKLDIMIKRMEREKKENK